MRERGSRKELFKIYRHQPFPPSGTGIPREHVTPYSGFGLWMDPFFGTIGTGRGHRSHHQEGGGLPPVTGGCSIAMCVLYCAVCPPDPPPCNTPPQNPRGIQTLGQLYHTRLFLNHHQIPSPSLALRFFCFSSENGRCKKRPKKNEFVDETVDTVETVKPKETMWNYLER